MTTHDEPRSLPMTIHLHLHATRRRLVALAAALSVVLSAAVVPATISTAEAVAEPPALTNLDHLDWLTTEVAPLAQPGHTTYRLADEPDVGVLWTYAEPDGAGGWKPVGGGTYDSATDTWGQGAFNADDISRAAVVYLRHWRLTGSTTSRRHAYQLLRGLAYLQTATGPNAGNVVLWMQPDGTPNPSADPVELPDPSDSGQSYWLARTVWALSEGYAAFQRSDPEFASFLRARLDLAVGAVDRQVLVRYGEHLDIDGEPAPAWLVTDGADASAEAVLGLSAYVAAGGPPTARRALTRLSRGIAELSDGGRRTWPFGAIRPWAQSRSVWHSWGSQMPAALVRASAVLDRPALSRAAARDSFTFDPWLLTSGGPDNGRSPTRVDQSQIAYGADSRVQSLVATIDAAGDRGVRRGARRLAGVFGGWFFGANPAGEPMYDPGTGVTYDGISADGAINRNSGAESTIHGLLTMLALDGHPRVAALAQSTTHVKRRVGTLEVQAEQATFDGPARAVAPADLWTGEAQYGGTGYAELGDGGRATIAVPPHPRSLVLPVVGLQLGSSATTAFRGRGRVLGRVSSGAVGEQGDSPAPGALLPVTLRRTLPVVARREVATTRADGGDVAALDAVLLEPVVSRVVLSGDGGGTVVLSNRLRRAVHTRAHPPGTGPATVESYDGSGHLVSVRRSSARRVPVTVAGGGFSVVHR